jgi:hypothetical protein
VSALSAILAQDTDGLLRTATAPTDSPTTGPASSAAPPSLGLIVERLRVCGYASAAELRADLDSLALAAAQRLDAAETPYLEAPDLERDADELHAGSDRAARASSRRAQLTKLTKLVQLCSAAVQAALAASVSSLLGGTYAALAAASDGSAHAAAARLCPRASGTWVQSVLALG